MLNQEEIALIVDSVTRSHSDHEPASRANMLSYLALLVCRWDSHDPCGNGTDDGWHSLLKGTGWRSTASIIDNERVRIVSAPNSFVLSPITKEDWQKTVRYYMNCPPWPDGATDMVLTGSNVWKFFRGQPEPSGIFDNEWAGEAVRYSPLKSPRLVPRWFSFSEDIISRTDDYLTDGPTPINSRYKLTAMSDNRFCLAHEKKDGCRFISTPVGLVRYEENEITPKADSAIEGLNRGARYVRAYLRLPHVGLSGGVEVCLGDIYQCGVGGAVELIERYFDKLALELATSQQPMKFDINIDAQETISRGLALYDKGSPALVDDLQAGCYTVYKGEPRARAVTVALAYGGVDVNGVVWNDAIGFPHGARKPKLMKMDALKNDIEKGFLDEEISVGSIVKSWPERQGEKR